MSKPLKPIPKFSSESEERAFWESRKNDSTEYVDWTKAKLVIFSDAVRTLLTRIANEDALPFTQANNVAAHDVWIRAKVHEALDDPRPAIAHEKAEARFAGRRAAARRKV